MQAYQILQRMTFSKTVNQTVVKAVRSRLERMLENKEAQYKKWQEDIKHKLNKTRQRDIQRHFEKTIQAYKIIIFDLTPYFDRVGDPPAFIVNKKNKTMKFILLILSLGLLACSSGLSESEKNLIRVNIFIHNQRVDGKFFTDSLEQATNIRIKYIGTNKKGMNEEIKTAAQNIAETWNEPYTIERDRFLTYDKYIKYCKEHSLDPKTYLDEIKNKQDGR